ncbi:MAG: 16S rRNA (cytosine(1402)-N(4))-methyltransferase RsmH [Desulfonauticus sp.]|nr:16S rRNA (cytosine(1402)-N(4))-methyltransferase RsmH [Desulfonauticus sp.]
MNHQSVLKQEIINWLKPELRSRVLDGTVGLGGHAEALLECGAKELLGLDLDRDALNFSQKRLAKFGQRVHLFQSNYVNFDLFLDQLGWEKVDAVLLDLGVSSWQLDNPKKGFSFLHQGPLDMRMDTKQSQSAFHLVNQSSFEQLKNILQKYGEEPLAGRIARFIIEEREKTPITSTTQLASIVEKAYPLKRRLNSRKHPATKTFQALRIAVNNELTSLSTFLQKIIDRISSGGRIAIISFHSLEDRIVKQFFKQEARDCICPPQLPICQCNHRARLKILTKKPLGPDEREIVQNPRSRSAKLRVAEKI